MSYKFTVSTQSTLVKTAESLGAVVVGFLVAWVSSPAALNLVPKTYEFLVAGVIIPVLLGLQKFLQNKSAAKAAAAGK